MSGSEGWVLLWTLPALWVWGRDGRRAWAALGEQRRLGRQHYRETLRLRAQVRATRLLLQMWVAEGLALLGLLGLLGEGVRPGMGVVLLSGLAWALLLVGARLDRDAGRLAVRTDREIARLPPGLP